MRLFEHPILQRVVELGAPHPEDIVITHGSALVIYGIREKNPRGDIDIVTTKQNITYLQEILGWKEVPRTIGYDKAGVPKTVSRTVSLDGEFDVYLHDFVAAWAKEQGQGRVQLSRLKEFSEQDRATGIWVAMPQFVRLTKEKSPRQKDIDDIVLIDTYLERLKHEAREP